MASTPLLPDLFVVHAEGNAFVRSMMREILLRVGLKQLYEAGDAEQLLKFLSGRAPDIVILDWNCPSISGQDAIRLIRNPELSPSPRVPVITTMTQPTREAVLRAAEAGANEVIAKPFSPKVIWQHLQGIVQGPRSFQQSNGILVPAARLAG